MQCQSSICLVPSKDLTAIRIQPQSVLRTLNKEKIEFEVDGIEEVVKVEMKNNIEVKVPDTLSSRSALLITISMFDIFLGIGIITYVKKSKIKEKNF